MLERDRTVPFYRTESERFYRDSGSSDPAALLELPSVLDPASLSLTVVIPAKDEQLRLPDMLNECIASLEHEAQRDPTFTYEIILVDDYSTDNTVEVALSYARRLGNEKMRVLSLSRNRGKGGAVRLGFWAARGRCLLFADADGATKFDDFYRLRDRIAECVVRRSGARSVDLNIMSDEENAPAVVVGSRAHMEKESIVKRSLFRTILMFGFHFLVWLFCVRDIKDTQCGFKLFTRPAVRLLFSNLHIERWAFDVELLFLAEKLNVEVAEVPVTWHEVPGSKLTPLAASLQMARDLFMIWFRYFFGIWSIDTAYSS